MCVGAVPRIWTPAVGGHDPLPPSHTRGPAESQWHHPVPPSHTRVPEDGTRLPDTPACSERSGWVCRDPLPPQDLLSHHGRVRVSGCGAPRDRVSSLWDGVEVQAETWGHSLPSDLCFCVNLTGSTSAPTNTETCLYWPTWVSCSLLTLDQLDLYIASPPIR